MKKLFTTGCLLVASIFGMSVFAQEETIDEFTANDREYHLIYLSENVELDYLNANPNNKIVQDLRVNDYNTYLWYWENTYTSPDPTGANYYGEFDGYLNLVVGNVGWSGAGFSVSKDSEEKLYIDFTQLLEKDAVFHVAMKSSSNISHLLILGGGNGLEGKVCVGSTAFIDNNIPYQPKADFDKDNKWHLVEIPVADFTGFASYVPFDDGNYFAFLSGNNPGANIAMDAIFIYSDLNETGINNAYASAGSLDAIVTNNVVTFVGAKGNPIELYNTSGMLVKTLDEAIIGVDELVSGLYIAKSGNAVTKFIIK